MRRDVRICGVIFFLRNSLMVRRRSFIIVRFIKNVYLLEFIIKLYK